MPSIIRTAVAMAAVAGMAAASNGDLPEKMTVGIVGDFGWTGWKPAPRDFCNNVLPKLQAAGVAIPNEVLNDCDPGDYLYIKNATALQADTAEYIGQICESKNCQAILTVGDLIYDSGLGFNTAGLLRFQEAWQKMYSQGIFEKMPWYMVIGNHDVVQGQSGIDFNTKIAPMWDSRWRFGSDGLDQLPYYTYDLEGKDWKATFVVLDSDCFVESYQKPTSVYQNEYTATCYKHKQEQLDFLDKAFSESNADWKFLQMHHPYLSAAGNYTELEPIVDIVKKHKGTVLNGHDHCLGHYFGAGTNFILSGAAGYPQAGDCNNGVKVGPYEKFLGANNQSAANGFVTLEISKEQLLFEYFARDMKFDGGDLYPVSNDQTPVYSFTVDEHSI